MADERITESDADPAPEAEMKDSPADASDAPAAVQSLGEELEATCRQRDEYYDRLLRKTAEFDNYRKRTDRERREMSERAGEDLIEELLPLLDDLERALLVDAGSDASESYRRGVEIIHKKLVDLLRRRGVRPIDAVGADFDPHFHQAVVHEQSAEHREGEVIEEFRRGYMMGDRLLRPTMVKVAKG